MEDIYSHEKNQTPLKTYKRNSELMTSRKRLDLEMFRKPSKASDTYITVFHNQITDNCNYTEKNYIITYNRWSLEALE